MAATDTFFEESREQSVVKAEIVEKYFDTWASIITTTQNRQPSAEQRLAYIDLFAGPGRYENGTISTPLRVLQRAINNPRYHDRLITVFNDWDSTSVRTLEEAIKTLPGIEKLKNAPVVWNEEVGTEIARDFEKVNKIPVLAFIDPWGYKGLSLQLVNSFVKDWGCDCIFFFNYSRINAGLSNPAVHEHMCALFGAERATRLRGELEPLTPEEREATIVNELALALKELGARFVLPFCFKNDTGTRTKHHLILVTKHFKGYDVMKDIMAAYSTVNQQGVPSFSYFPFTSQQQTFLFELNRPLDQLRDMLLASFAGQTLNTQQIYEEHSVDRPFVKKNYKEVLKKLEDDKAITTKGRKTKAGFADHLVVSFPRRT